ncbi:MAG: DUF2510 domain-containing protein [Schumannella sp.]
MSVTVLTDPAPGWYLDPAGIAAYRWWNGATWTEGTHAGETVETAEPVVLEPVRPVAVAPEPVAPEPVALQPAPVHPVHPVRRGVSPAKTRWSSLLTAYPVVYPIVVGMITALAYAGGAAGSTTTLVVIAGTVAVAGLIPAWGFAANDRRELLERGYRPAPALVWMLLLPPIAYLIARRRIVGPAS